MPRRGLPRIADGETLAFAIMLLVVAALALLPVGRLAATAFWPKGVFDPSLFWLEVGSRSAWRASLNSLQTSLAGAAGALVLGTLFALAVALTDIGGRRPLAFLFVLSAMMAPQVTALAFLTLTGPSSPLLVALGWTPAPGTSNPLVGRGGIILVLALHHAPLAFVTVRAALRNIPRDLIEAARVAGDRPAGILRRIVLPLLRPSLIAAAALVFVACLGNFGIPALLGMPVGVHTLPTLIYMTLSSSGPGVLAEVAALSMLVTGLALIGLAVTLAVRPVGVARMAAYAPAEQVFALGRWRPVVAVLLWLVVAVVLVVPLLSLIATALIPAFGVPLSAATVTLDNLVEVLVRQEVTARALRNSAVYAGAAALILAVAAIPFAHALDRRAGRAAPLVESAFELPFALPGVVLAIAMILIFLKPLPLLGVSLYATAAIIVVAYLARFAAIAVKAPVVAIRQMPRDLEEAARMCGARYLRRMATIVLPFAAPAAAAGALLVFLTAFNELTVSALLWSAGTETLGVVLFNLEDGGYGTLAAAVAVLATAVIAALMLLLDLGAGRLPRGVVPWR